MTVKKALIIGTLAVVLTGITACAISYTKKTGKNPFKTMQVKAEEFNNITFNSNGTLKTATITETTSTGDPETAIEYITTITKTETAVNGTIKITKFRQFPILNGQETQIIATSGTQNIINTSTTKATTFNYNKDTKELTVNWQITNTFTTDLENEVFTLTTQESVFIVPVINITGEYDHENTINVANNFQTIENAYTTGGETTNAYQLGYDNGEQAGYNTGYTAGNEYGYATGYNDGQAFASPIDIRGLMLNILTMPFTFISQAFNVTMWEGTPYQINLSNLILSLIAIATILFIIKLFTSGFSAIGNYTGNKADKLLDRKVKKSQIKVNESKANLNDRTKGK